MNQNDNQNELRAFWFTNNSDNIFFFKKIVVTELIKKPFNLPFQLATAYVLWDLKLLRKKSVKMMIMFPTRELIFIYSSHLRKYTRHHLSLCDNACRISIIIKLSNYEPITYFHKRVLNARNNLKICVRFPRFLSLTLLFSRILSYQFLFNRGVSTYVVVEGCVFLWKNELSLSSCCC